MKNEFKCSNISFMHDHALHGTLHQIYVFLSKTGMQSEKGFGLDKSFKKTFGKEEGNSNRSEFSKGFQTPTRLVINDKPGSVGAYWI